jgi:hypothetical protein
MTGTLLLAAISAVSVADILIALNFLARANCAESAMGAPPAPDATNPEALRRVARMLFVTAPLMWLVAAALSFGLIPIDGIVPIKF